MWFVGHVVLREARGAPIRLVRLVMQGYGYHYKRNAGQHVQRR